MDTQSGEIKQFESEAEIPKGWVELKLHTHVEFKGLLFQIIEINTQKNTVLLKGIPKLSNPNHK